MNESEYFTKVEQNIATYGWHCQGVFPTKEDGGPPFAYTVGLLEFGLPELLMIGMDATVIQQLFITALKKVPLAPGPLPGVIQAPYELVVVEATAPAVGDYITVAKRRAEIFEQPLTVLQLVWPDEYGHYPWDEDWSLPAELQPVLG